MIEDLREVDRHRRRRLPNRWPACRIHAGPELESLVERTPERLVLVQIDLGPRNALHDAQARADLVDASGSQAR